MLISISTHPVLNTGHFISQNIFYSRNPSHHLSSPTHMYTLPKPTLRHNLNFFLYNHHQAPLSSNSTATTSVSTSFPRLTENIQRVPTKHSTGYVKPGLRKILNGLLFTFQQVKETFNGLRDTFNGFNGLREHSSK